MFKQFVAVAVLASAAGLQFGSTGLAAGALAIGTEPDRIWYGLNANSGSVRIARREAMDACTQHGPCRVETVFWNKCMALAWQGSGHSGYGWATRDSPRQAARAALRACENRGRPCQVESTRCDTTGR
jgi:hypothetical protein